MKHNVLCCIPDMHKKFELGALFGAYSGFHDGETGSDVR